MAGRKASGEAVARTVASAVSMASEGPFGERGRGAVAGGGGKVTLTCPKRVGLRKVAAWFTY
ncbi:hypothetical protein GCM10009680_46130 [Streptomyces yatensis]|uniref:Uncharacterized protein n=1 Tax=Streptomyces yatensis TaxID=155177 RepID=A0ABP4U7V0_9ACTN